MVTGIGASFSKYPAESISMKGLVGQHRNYAFTVEGVMRAAFLSLPPAVARNLMVSYDAFRGQALSIIVHQVSIASERLNIMLRAKLGVAIQSTHEYGGNNMYSRVLDHALSTDAHRGLYFDNRGLVQARYINLAALGDLGDLQRVNHEAYKRVGTFQGWVGLYIAHLKGRKSPYSNMVNSKCGILYSEGIAPFWDHIEFGRESFPPIEGTSTIFNFKRTYFRVMRRTFISCVAMLASSFSFAFAFTKTRVDMMIYEGKTYLGYSWTSKQGNRVFVIGNSEKIRGSVMTGRGFVTDKGGGVTKYVGRIPGVGLFSGKGRLR